MKSVKTLKGEVTTMGSSLALFEKHRSRLFGLGYRMTGSVAEAEDIVQETFVKWLTLTEQEIESPEGWLVRVATRLALDHLKSAQVKRRSYVGPWLPEPLIADLGHPEAEMSLDESVSMALLVLLEKLTPAERAAYILHDLFQLSFAEVSGILEKPNATCRQLASRARRKISPEPSQNQPSLKQYHRVVPAFLDAVKSGDMTALSQVLREDVVFHADGGGRVAAAPEILHGFPVVAAFILEVLHPISKLLGTPKVNIRETWFNGAPGLVLRVGGKPVTAFNFRLEDEKIGSIHALRNPAKLEYFPRFPRD